MKILAIETSTITGGVAILHDKHLVAEGRLSVKAIYSERLMALVDFLLESVKIDISEIDYYALAIGPGSFTGLRVGLSTAKGLAYATGRLVTPVSTLKAMAMNLPFVIQPICPLLDARKGEVYWGLYRNNQQLGLDTLIPDRVSPVKEICQSITEPTIFIGEGLLVYQKDIHQSIPDKAIFGRGIEMYPSPYNVGLLGYEQILEGNVLDAFAINSAYYRKAEAELKKVD